METINSVVSDSIVEKIRKLLALASNLNDSKEQAELAMQKAKALAVQHDVELAAIQVFENKKSEEPIVEGEALSLGKRKSVCQTFITRILQTHFKVKVLYSGGRWSGQQLILIGTKSDISIAAYVNQFLNSEFMRLWQRFHKTYQNSQVKDRNSYFWGLSEGFQSKLEEGAKNSQQDAFTTMSQSHTTEQVDQVKNQYALTVTTHQERLDEALGKMYPKLRTIRSYTRHSHSGEARQAGFSAGRNINVSRGIGNGNGGFIS